jgi:uncharacterized protein (TIGR02391 family)
MVSGAAGTLFDDGHLSQAVFEAFKAVESRVQRLAVSQETGKGLMSTVFGSAVPALDVTTAAGRNADDEREGFKFMFMGVICGLRNPRGHGGELPATAEETLEYLAVASMLMRRLDIAESRLTL